MHLHRLTISALFAFCLLSVVQSPVKGAEKQVPELLPASTVIYAEIKEPAKLWDVVLNHPIGKQVLELDDVKKELAKPGVKGIKQGITFVEQQIGMNWQQGLSTVTGGGIYVAIDAETEGLAVFVKSKDKKTLEKLKEIFLQAARDEAKKKEKPDPIQSKEYRGVTAYQAGEVLFATIDQWLIMVNKKELGESILNAYLDGSRTTLTNQPQFMQARKKMSNNPTAWTYLDIKTLRDSGVAKKLYQEKTDNPLGELLLGGFLGGLQKTPYLTSSLFIEAEKLKISVEMPHQADWVKEARQYYFGKEKQGVAQKRLVPKDSIFTLSTHRDLSQYWLNSSDLFVDRIDAGFAKANATLSTLFSGKDFGEEILGSMGSDVQIVVSRQKFDETQPIPAIKLPAFALIFKLKDADNIRDDMRRTFQSLLGFINVVGGQEQGSPQLDIETEKSKEMQLVISKYIPPRGKEKAKQVKIHYNFSPTFAFLKDKMILSSTTPLARELAALIKNRVNNKQRVNNANLNTDMALDIPTLMKVVHDNRNHLIVQNMLKEGKERKEAEKEFDLIEKIATWFKSSSLQLITEKERLKIDFQIDLTKK